MKTLKEKRISIKCFIGISIFFLFTNCAPQTYFSIEVDSYGSDSRLNSKKYILAPHDTTINTDDLEYIEFSDYVKKILSHKGYLETKNSDSADLIIAFKYGIGDPKNFEETVRVPVYGQTGSETTTQGNTNVNNVTVNVNTNTKKTDIPKLDLDWGGGETSKSTTSNTYGITGYQTEKRTYTEHLRYLTIVTYDLKAYKTDNKEKIIWKTILTSWGSSGDLRKVLPYMVVVGSVYFGKNSGEKIPVKIYENDARVYQLKN